LFAGLCQRFGQGADPQLLAVGADEEDLAGSDAVVDPDLVCSYLVTYSTRGFLEGRNLNLVPDATMVDTGMSAIKRPPTRWSRNMRTRRTCLAGGVSFGGRVGTVRACP
jgi:hypothetical protein